VDERRYVLENILNITKEMIQNEKQRLIDEMNTDYKDMSPVDSMTKWGEKLYGCKYKGIEMLMSAKLKDDFVD